MMNPETQYNLLNQKIAEENERSAAIMKEKADYKIQIWFKSDRSMHSPIAFTLSFWESGKRMHGGGDEMMFICKRNEDAKDVTPFEVASVSKGKASARGCGSLIPGEMVLPGGLAVCPHCGVKHKSTEIGDSIFYRATIDNAAKILETWWRKLDGNADIYAKYSPTDPRTKMMYQNYNHIVAREKKGLTIYPLKNILKDTSAGASVFSRFKAFITA